MKNTKQDKIKVKLSNTQKKEIVYCGGAVKVQGKFVY